MVSAKISLILFIILSVTLMMVSATELRFENFEDCINCTYPTNNFITNIFGTNGFIWNITGNFIYPSIISNKLGIGKSNPAATLDVEGTINATAGTFYTTLKVKGFDVNYSISLDNYNFSVMLDSYNKSIMLNSYYNSIGDIPTAIPSDGDTTHFSLADQIYDWVIGLSYITNTVNDLVNYFTKSQINSILDNDTINRSINLSDYAFIVDTLTLSSLDNATINRSVNLSDYNFSVSLDDYIITSELDNGTINRSINLSTYNFSVSLDKYNDSVMLNDYISSAELDNDTINRSINLSDYNSSVTLDDYITSAELDDNTINRSINLSNYNYSISLDNYLTSYTETDPIMSPLNTSMLFYWNGTWFQNLYNIQNSSLTSGLNFKQDDATAWKRVNSTLLLDNATINRSINLSDYNYSISLDDYITSAELDNASINRSINLSDYNYSVDLEGYVLDTDVDSFWNLDNNATPLNDTVTTALNLKQAEADAWNLDNNATPLNDTVTANINIRQIESIAWKEINDTAALVIFNSSLIDIYVNRSGDIMIGNLDMTDHNLTGVQRLIFPDGTSIRFGTHSKFTGMDNALNLMSNRPLTSGAISHVFIDMMGGKILRTLQVGLPDAAGFMRNSQIISGDFGITNGTKLSRCSEMAEQMGGTEGLDLDGVGCNTTSLGASLLLEGSQRIGHRLVIGGGNKSTYGIQSQGFANFNMEGQEFNIFNGTLHPLTPRIEEIGLATGDLSTLIDEDFEDNSILPFQKREQTGTDDNNWLADEDLDFCLDGICARAKGGDGNALRIIEHNISTIDRDSMNISFYFGARRLDASDNASVIGVIESTSTEILLWNSSVVGNDNNINPTLITTPIDSALDDKTLVSIRFQFSSDKAGGGAGREEFWIDDILMLGSATASTRENVTRRDTEIHLGDGSQRIFWNDSTKTLELPANVSVISESIADLIISGTITLGSKSISSFDDIVVGLQNETVAWKSENFTNNLAENFSDISQFINDSGFNYSINLDNYNFSISLDKYNYSVNLDNYNKSLFDLSQFNDDLTHTVAIPNSNASTACDDGEFLRGETDVTCKSSSEIVNDGGGITTGHIIYTDENFTNSLAENLSDISRFINDSGFNYSISLGDYNKSLFDLSQFNDDLTHTVDTNIIYTNENFSDNLVENFSDISRFINDSGFNYSIDLSKYNFSVNLDDYNHSLFDLSQFNDDLTHTIDTNIIYTDENFTNSLAENFSDISKFINDSGYNYSISLDNYNYSVTLDGYNKSLFRLSQFENDDGFITVDTDTITTTAQHITNITDYLGGRNITEITGDENISVTRTGNNFVINFLNSLTLIYFRTIFFDSEADLTNLLDDNYDPINSNPTNATIDATVKYPNLDLNVGDDWNKANNDTSAFLVQLGLNITGGDLITPLNTTWAIDTVNNSINEYYNHSISLNDYITSETDPIMAPLNYSILFSWNETWFQNLYVIQNESVTAGLGFKIENKSDITVGIINMTNSNLHQCGVKYDFFNETNANGDLVYEAWVCTNCSNKVIIHNNNVSGMICI